MSNQLTEQDEIILLSFNQLNPKKVKLVACEPKPEQARNRVGKKQHHLKPVLLQRCQVCTVIKMEQETRL